VSIFDEPKIDCHVHVLDPARFPYAAEVAYRPSGQEIGTLGQLHEVMDSYNVQHALVVGPNSGYGLDNRCLLNALASGGGRFKGIAVVANDTSYAVLTQLKSQGVVGIAFNATLFGTDYYSRTDDLLAHLETLGMYLQIQVEKDQILALLPILNKSGVKLLIDHCGRPSIAEGVKGIAFQALLKLGKDHRAAIKLSGLQKYSHNPQNFADTLPFALSLMDAFTLDACLWASDWPFLKAPERLDYGPLLRFFERLVPTASDRQKVLWDTPKKWFGF
jgi:predicted TIM-barrel fold metal-dependent hydrolase